MLADIAVRLKEMITVRDVCEQYGIEINRQGFAVCPFHTEDTPSMKVYEGSRGFNCYGCGKNGDVITFVAELFSLNFRQSLEKLNSDFSLGLPLERKMTLREKYSLKEAEKQRKAEKQEREDRIAAYSSAYDLFCELDRMRIKHRPKSPDEELHPDFVKALRGLAAAEYKLNEAEGELFSYEMRKMRRQNDSQRHSQ